MDFNNTIDLTPLCELLIALLGLVITTYIVPWIKAHTTVKQQEYLHAAAHVAVYAAEKFYGAGNGDKKLEYAEKVLKEDYGITLNIDKLEAVIDSVIKEMEQAKPPRIVTGELPEAETSEEESGEEDEEPQTESAPEGA